MLSFQGWGQTIKNMGYAWPIVNCGNALINITTGSLNISNIKYYALIGSLDNGVTYTEKGSGSPVTMSSFTAYATSSGFFIVGFFDDDENLIGTSNNGVSDEDIDYIHVNVQTRPVISGIPTLTYGDFTTFTATTAPSTTTDPWVSSSTSIAIINPTSGLITPISVGSTIITYTNSSSCTKTFALTISKKSILVTARASQAKVYGAANPTTYTYDVSPLLTGLTPLNGTLTRIAGEDVNVYAIEQNDLTTTNNPNYTISYVGDNFSITKKGITITARASQTKVYGAADPATYTYDVSPSITGLVALTGLLTRASGQTVGVYAIAQGTLANPNYDITYVGNNFTITKAILTIRAENKTKTQGDPNPAFTFTYSGFVTGENPTSLTTLPTATCSANNNSAVGSYPIIPAGGVAANYTFVYQNGTLTITAPLIMKFEIPNAFIPTDIYVDNRFLKASYNASVQKVISFKIYNRMGNMLKEWKDVHPSAISWDGKYKDVLQESDVYMWVAEISGLGTTTYSTSRGQFLLLK